MPAKSKAQQRFMGMVRQCQETGKCPSKAVEKTAKSIKKKDASDFARTKHKNLPKRVNEMAKGGQRYKNMGKSVVADSDKRDKPANNLSAKHVGATSRGGAMKKKTDYRRTAKHKGKVFEGTFKTFLEMCGCQGGENEEAPATPEILQQKINNIKTALENMELPQNTKDQLQAMLSELTYEYEETAGQLGEGVAPTESTPDPEYRWSITDKKKYKRMTVKAPDRAEAIKIAVARFGHRNISVVKITD